jgi:polyribonucleotide 5'-hydroxyl-kinase
MMPKYLKVYEIIEEKMASAKKLKSRGPCILLAGPNDSGKSTLIKILSNLSVRMGWKPTVVDLDVDQGILTVPGCVSAAILEQPWDIEKGLPFESLIAFYFGYLKPTEASYYFKTLFEHLACVLEKRNNISPDTNSSATYINTMGFANEVSYEQLLNQIDAFSCNIVIVIGQDKLYSQLLAHTKNRNGRNFDVITLPRSGAVVTRNADFRKSDRNRRIHEYFFGFKDSLVPVQINSVHISNLDIYHFGGHKTPPSALPIATTHLHDPLRKFSLTISNDMKNTLLAISNASSPDEAILANIAGFIQILDVDVKNQLVSYRSPNSGKFPGTVLIAGNYTLSSIEN